MAVCLDFPINFSSLKDCKCSCSTPYNNYTFFFNTETNEVLDQFGNIIGTGVMIDGMIQVTRYNKVDQNVFLNDTNELK